MRERWALFESLPLGDGKVDVCSLDGVDELEQPTLPRDEEFWPVHRIGVVEIPRATPPPRFGPP